MTGTVMLSGWTGSAAVRLPLLWGYGEQYAEHEENLDCPAADVSLTFSTVPAGEIWVITSFSARGEGSDTDWIELRAVIGAVVHCLKARVYGTAQETVELQGRIVLAEDDYLLAYFESVGLNDKVYADAVGYKMLVA